MRAHYPVAREGYPCGRFAPVTQRARRTRGPFRRRRPPVSSSMWRFAVLALGALLLIAPSSSRAADDPFVMAATSYTSGYAPAYIGNGYVGTRVPAAGMGFVAGDTVPTSTII